MEGGKDIVEGALHETRILIDNAKEGEGIVLVEKLKESFFTKYKK